MQADTYPTLGSFGLIDDEILPSVSEVLDHLDAAVARWRFSDDQTNLHMAAAALRQGARLTRSALILAASEEPAGVNVLVRSAFEYWLMGAWLVFGGEDAIIGVELERYRWQIILAERVGETDTANTERHTVGLAKLRDEQAAYQQAGSALPAGRASSVVLLQVAERLGALIKARFPEDTDADVTQVYDLLYRSHSTMDAHPPLTINKLTGDGDRVKVGLQPWLPPANALRVMTPYLCLLGHWIDATLGEPVQLWDDLIARFR